MVDMAQNQTKSLTPLSVYLFISLLFPSLYVFLSLSYFPLCMSFYLYHSYFSLCISLIILCCPSRFHVELKSGDNVALHFNPRIADQIVVRNSFLDGEWGDEEKEHSHFPFEESEPFEIFISSQPDAYKVSENNKFLLFLFCYFCLTKYFLLLSFCFILMSSYIFLLFGLNLIFLCLQFFIVIWSIEKC